MIQSAKLVRENATTKQKVKTILGVIAGVSADAAITAALGCLIPVGGGVKRVLRLCGTFVIAMMVGEKVETYVEGIFDEFDKELKEAKAERENAKLEGAVK